MSVIERQEFPYVPHGGWDQVWCERAAWALSCAFGGLLAPEEDEDPTAGFTYETFWR